MAQFTSLTSDSSRETRSANPRSGFTLFKACRFQGGALCFQYVSPWYLFLFPRKLEKKLEERRKHACATVNITTQFMTRIQPRERKERSNLNDVGKSEMDNEREEQRRGIVSEQGRCGWIRVASDRNRNRERTRKERG